MKSRSIIISVMLFFTLTGCGYDGHYRYPCQDPANWKSADCKPPICTADGTCPENVNENIKEQKNG